MTASANRLAELQRRAQYLEHGKRSKYIAGCHCNRCTKANREYERKQRRLRCTGRSNPLVDAGPAREHLATLAAAGVGYKSAAIAAGLSQSTVFGIKRGARRFVSARNLARILAVTDEMRGDHALVDAAPTWRRIDRLVEAGYTKAQLAEWMGVGRSIQFPKAQITAKTELRVRRLEQLLDQGRLQRK